MHLKYEKWFYVIFIDLVINTSSISVFWKVFKTARYLKGVLDSRET